MSIQLTEENDENTVAVFAGGKLVKEDCEHFVPEFDRLAMVEQGMATFCKPFTKAGVRYFDRSAVLEARKWLE